MTFFDIHTHRVPLYPEQAIVSCSVGDSRILADSLYISVGIHPWHLTDANVETLWNSLQEAVKRANVLALGEVGLDKQTEPSLNLQKSVLRQEILLAEEYGLPLIIHCVRAFNELLQLKREIKPLQPWVIHGFRGKAELAEMCLRHGCYLSFGEKFQEAALKLVPSNRLLIETDESVSPIEDIYQRIAAVRAVSLEELSETIGKNVREVFFKP